MGKDNQGSALKRVLNRSLGYTEMATWHSKETIDLDKSYQTLLSAYDDIPDFGDQWSDIQKRYDDLTAKLKDLETTKVANNPKARTAHQKEIESQIPIAQTLKGDIEKKAVAEKLRIISEADKIKLPKGSPVEEQTAITDAVAIVKTTLAGAPTSTLLAKARTELQGAAAKANETAETVKKRLEARTKLIKACAAIVDPRGSNAAQVSRLDTQRKKVTGLLPKPIITDKQIEDAGKEQKALEKLVKEIEAEVAARGTFEKRLGEVTRMVDDAAGSVDATAAAFLKGKVVVAKGTGTTATDAVGWNKAIGELNSVADKVPEATAYFAKYDELSKLKDNYTKTAPSTQTARLEQLITDAAGLAASNNYTGAKAKLEAFEGDAGVKEVKAFYKRMSEFRTLAGDKMAVLKSGVANKPANLNPDNELQRIKDSCVGKTTAADYQNMLVEITAFEKRIIDSHAYVERYNVLDEFVNSPGFALLAGPEKTALNTAMSEAKALADANPGDPAAALAKLQQTKISGAKISKPVAAGQLKKQAESVYAALNAVASGAGPTTHVKGLLDAADARFRNKEFSVAEGLYQTLVPLAQSALGYAERLKEAETAVATVTLGGKPDVLKAAKDRAATNDFSAALPLLESGLKTLGEFVAYETHLAQVKALKETFGPEAEDELAQLGGIAKEAADLARTGKYIEALATLATIAHIPDLAGPNKEVAAYFEQRRTLERGYTAARGALALGEARNFLKGFWDDAGTLAGQKNYKAGIAKLATLASHFGPAVKFAAEHKGAGAVSKSLADLDAAGRGVYTTTVKKTDLAALITAAESAAKIGDFATANVKLNEFRTKARGLCATAATDHDTSDGSANVHPHSVAKHLNVTDSDKENRVKTGVPPPPTQAASSFDDAESWVAAREAALDAGKSRAGYKLTDDKATVPDKTTIVIHIEHNHPIGSAMIGVRENTVVKQGGPNKGELGANGTFERVVKVTGYTRSSSVFRFDAAEGPKGKWVLLTQYPYTEDWDAELGCYTKPLPT